MIRLREELVGWDGGETGWMEVIGEGEVLDGIGKVVRLRDQGRGNIVWNEEGETLSVVGWGGLLAPGEGLN